MAEKILVTGGCRSGKSGFALKKADELNPQKKIFIATCRPLDNEMEERVSRHQKERDGKWQTIEEPLLLEEAIRENSTPETLILVDCITLWLTNLLMENDDLNFLEQQAISLAKVLKQVKGEIILVTNEVGAGIVPENRLARVFRDAAGFANQRIAESVDSVIWAVSGIPVKIK